MNIFEQGFKVENIAEHRVVPGFEQLVNKQIEREDTTFLTIVLGNKI